MPLFRRRRLLAAAALALPAAHAAPGMEWVAADLRPVAWSAPGGPQGYAHDLAVAMARQLGRPGRVSYVPWARAVHMVEQGGNYGVFPLVRTPEREVRFQWLVPLMVVRYGLYTLATRAPLSLDELRPLRVGLLRGSPIGAHLKAEGFQSLLSAKDYKDLLRLLREGTIDAIYASTFMLEAAMDALGQPRSDYALRATLGEGTLYMATSLSLDADEVRRWLAAYQALDENGTVAQLRRRYLP